ncbi:MAG: dihydroorotase family protein, partial [Desulfobacterota bacterium]|nr:dihydroorotase family protein [Thermodesulfobacteriota bacterium]
ASIHAEEASILTEEWNKFFRSGEKSLAEWAAHNPVEAEELGVIIAAFLAEISQCRVNIVHLATGAALARLKKIKKVNPFITAETIALYLSIKSSSPVVPEEARLSPAVRGSEDQEALWKGVEEGIIDTIGTDQDCVTREGLQMFIRDYGVSGSSAVTPLLLPLILTEGYHIRRIPVEKLVDKLTINPARLWGIYPQKGTIAVGSDADLVLVDLDREFVVDYRKLSSSADWSIYQGKKLKGFPVITIKGGKMVMTEGKIIAEWRNGKRIKMPIREGWDRG